MEKLKDKPVDYTSGGGTSENPNNGSGQSATPPSGEGTLNAAEQALVGTYTFGEGGSSIWVTAGTTFHGNEAQELKSYGSYIHSHKFNADGTYEYIQLTIGKEFTRGGAYIYGVGSWKVDKEGVALLAITKADVYYMDGTSTTHGANNRELAYEFRTENDKYGIYISEYSNFYAKE